jgi:hypothetical protein
MNKSVVTGIDANVCNRGAAESEEQQVAGVQL